MLEMHGFQEAPIKGRNPALFAAFASARRACNGCTATLW